MAWDFDAFSPTFNSPTEVRFAYTGNFGTSDIIEVVILGTNLNYDEALGAFGPSAVITRLDLFDVTSGLTLQQVNVGAADAAAQATDFLGSVLSIGGDIATAGGFPLGFDDVTVIMTPTEVQVTFLSGGSSIGVLKIGGSGFVQDVALGSVTSIQLFQADGSTPVWAAIDYSGSPVSLAAVSVNLGNSSALYSILTAGDDTVTALNQTSDGRSLDLDGGDGTNTINGSSLFGGFVTYENSSVGVTADLGAQSVTKDDATVDTLSNIGGVNGSQFADNLFGSNFNDILRGGGGDDFIDSQGVTTNEFGIGFDVMDGGRGNDTFSVNPFGGDAINYIVTYQFNGEDAANGVVVNLGTTPTTIDAGTALDPFGDTDTLQGVHNVVGTNFADIFDGSAQMDVFTPGAGNDTIRGGGGGADDDLLVYSPTAGLPNAFTITEGIDVNFTAAGTGTAVSKTTGEIGNDSFQDIEHVLGTEWGDSFTVSGAGVISATGMQGADTFTGGAGATDTVDYSFEVVGGGSLGIVVNFGAGNVGGVNTGEVRDTFNEVDTLSGIERVTGSVFNDIMFGGTGAEVFDGGQGGDAIFGGAGNDTIRGGGTFAVTGIVADLLAGDAGNDTIDGGSLSNLVLVNYSNENGTSGIIANLDSSAHDGVAAGHVRDTFLDTDTLLNVFNVIGSQNGDVFYGGAGNEVFTPGTGNDAVHGGGGQDEMWYSGVIAVRSGFGNLVEAFGYDGGITVTFSGDGTAGTVVGKTDVGVTTETGTDTFDGIEHVIGSELADTFIGSSVAGAQNVFVGMRGDDTYTGGSGAGDTIDYSYETFDGGAGGVTVDLGASTSVDTFGGTDTFSGIENVIGTVFSDELSGSADGNLLDGGAGDDTMNGGSGDDTYVVDNLLDVVHEADAGLTGGRDTVRARISYSLSALVDIEDLVLLDLAETGDGNGLDNSITGNAEENVLSGFGGNDILDGGAGLDNLIGGAGDDTYVLGGGADLVSELDGEGTADTITTTINRSLAAFDFVENLVLLTGAIEGTGNTLANKIDGNTAGNRLDGGVDALVDTLAGGAGNDTYVLGGGNDVVTELSGEGTADTITTTITRSLTGYNFVENLELLTGALDGTGNALANKITGNVAGNKLDGGADALADILVGAGGNDTYFIRSANDVIQEVNGAGTDRAQVAVSYVLAAGVSIEVLETINAAAATAINLTGNNLAQTINGNNGANIIFGGLGKDVMKGGLGRDTFDFNSITETTKVSTTADAISDFTHLQDKINLRDIDANTKVAGNQNFTFLAAKGAAFTGVAGQVHYKALGANTVIEGDLDGNRTADFVILLTGNKVLTAVDFVL